jgi:hypothetical protein
MNRKYSREYATHFFLLFLAAEDLIRYTNKLINTNFLDELLFFIGGKSYFTTTTKFVAMPWSEMDFFFELLKNSIYE